MPLKLAALSTILLAFLHIAVQAAEPAADIPSHCKPGESAYLDAQFKENGKVLSLCLNDKATRLFYRYGAPGRVEMEKSATTKNRFWHDDVSDSPHTGHEYIFFDNAGYVYCIERSTGQAIAELSLSVLKSGKTILSLSTQNYREWNVEPPPELFAEKSWEELVATRPARAQ